MSENEQPKLGFDIILENVREHDTENPDDEDAQGLLEFMESKLALTCSFCLGKYHTVQTGCGTVNVLLEKFPGGSQNSEW